MYISFAKANKRKGNLPNRPNVDSIIVIATSLEYLWWAITHCDELRCFRGLRDPSSMAKVCNFNNAFKCKQDIGRFQIQVYVASAVNVCDTRDELLRHSF